MKNTTNFDLDGRVAVVTGGNGGIGRSIALGLARAGASVAILARNEQKNAAVLADLEQIGRPSFAMFLDVSKRATLADAIERTENALGGIDILVNNAGIGRPSGGVLNETEEDWDAVIETNLNACFLMAKLAATSMVKRGGGKIINIASMYSYFGSGIIPSYSASKGAIVQLTKSMAVEMAPHNIQVNAIAPGWFTTDLTAVIRDNPDFASFNQSILDRTPAGRWGETHELAGAAVFLASSAAGFVTGVTLPVDGGYSIA
ncbi:MAG: glucose 1-dehydrogenase [Acidobacteriota bacterium]